MTTHDSYAHLEDEIASVILIGTNDALKKYNPDKGSFFTFWKKSVIRMVSKYVKKYDDEMRHISLDKTIFEHHELHEYIASDEIITRNLLMENLLKTINNPKTGLTGPEKQVLKYDLLGYSFIEIAALMNYSKANVYRLHYQAIDKISVVLKKK